MVRKKLGRKKEDWTWTFVRVKILSILKQKGAMTKTKLAEELGIPRGSIYQNLEELKQRGLVWERKNDKKEGRPLELYVDLTNRADPVPLSIVKLTERLLKLDKKVKERYKAKSNKEESSPYVHGMIISATKGKEINQKPISKPLRSTSTSR